MSLAEAAYLDRPGARGFERPYGWGWLLALQAELELHEGDMLRAAETLRPLALGVCAALPCLPAAGGLPGANGHAFIDRVRAPHGGGLGGGVRPRSCST